MVASRRPNARVVAGKGKKQLKRIAWANEVGGKLVEILGGHSYEKGTVFNVGQHSGSHQDTAGGAWREVRRGGDGVRGVEPSRGKGEEGQLEHLRRGVTLWEKEEG